MADKPYCGCPPKKSVPCVLTPTECNPESIEPVGLYSGYEGGYDEGGVYALNQVVYFDGGLYLSLRACNRARPVKGMTTSEFFYYGATEGVDVSGFVTSVTSNPDNDKELLVVAGGQTTVVTLPSTNNIKSVANLDGDIVWFTREDGSRTPVDFSKYRNNPAVNVGDKHTHFESLDETIQKGVDSNGHPTEYYTPLQVGDTVTIDGCTYENMVKDNQGRPSKLSVFKGEWIDYCQLNTLLHCMFPAHIEQVEGCGECPESEKLVEDTPLCDRVTTLEGAGDKSLSTVNTVDGVTTLTMTDGTTFIIPATAASTDTKVVDFKVVDGWYVISNSDGTEHKVPRADPYDGATVIEQQYAKEGNNFTHPSNIHTPVALPDIEWTVPVAGTYSIDTSCRLYAVAGDWADVNNKDIGFDLYIYINGVVQDGLLPSNFTSANPGSQSAVDISAFGTGAFRLNVGDIITLGLEVYTPDDAGLNSDTVGVVGHSTGFLATRIGV